MALADTVKNMVNRCRVVMFTRRVVHTSLTSAGRQMARKARRLR